MNKAFENTKAGLWHTATTSRFITLALLALGLQPFILCLSATAQGTAFTYQGRLNDGANPANGLFDLQFGIYDAVTNGNQQGILITNSATAVSNGLFTVTLDFGNQFPGAARWLDISVRTNGNGVFATLTPRQLLTSTPYAVQAANAYAASSVQAGNIVGTIPPAELPASLVTNGATGVNFTGTFTGNGAGVTNVALANLNSDGFISSQGALAALGTISLAEGVAAVVAADVNGDGRVDLICANVFSNNVIVLTNNGSGGFVAASTNAVGTEPFSIVATNLSLDGKVDLVVGNVLDNTLSVLTNAGGGNFSTAFLLPVGPGPIGIVAVDVNGDGKLDLACSDGNTNTLSILTNNGAGGFVLASSPTVGSGPFGLAAADFNGDGKIDLVSANVSTNTLSILTNSGNGNFVLASTVVVGNGPRSVAAADLNGDGKIDLVCANSADNTLSVLTNNGSGGFVAASTLSVGNDPDFVLTADVSGDGKMDLVCVNQQDNTVMVLTNDGRGNFNLFSTIGVGQGPFSATAADINGDGKADVVTANALSGTLTLILNSPIYSGNFNGNSSGTFIGDGSGLTSLNASNITSGTLPFFALSGYYFNQVSFTNPTNLFYGSFSGNGDGLTLSANQIVAGVIPPGVFEGTYYLPLTFNNPNDSFAGDGSGLISLNASQLTSGTVPSAALAGIYSSALSFTNAGNIFVGDGSGLTNLSFSELSGGTLPASALSGTYSLALTLNNAGNSFTGNGGGLTNLNASQLTSGTVPDARLSANVALRSVGNNFTGNQTVTSGNVGIGISTPIYPLTFPPSTGDKISLWTDAGGSNNYGFGIQGFQLQVHTDTTNADIVFGSGDSTNFTETMRIKGGGSVGIGTTSPQQLLQVGDSTVSGSQGMIQVASRANGGSAARLWDFGCPIDPANANDTTGKNFSFIIQDTASTAPNFLIRWDTHDVGIDCTNPIALLTVGSAASPAYCDGTTWVNGSDRNAKEDFSAINAEDVLAKVAALPLTEWQYKAAPGQAHLGPMAQDFHAAFGLNGSDDKHISTVDEGGVALAAIQGLNQKLEGENQKLEAQNAELKARLDKLEQLINSANGNSKPQATE